MWNAVRRGWGIRGARLRTLGLTLLPFAAFFYVQALSTRFALVWSEVNPYAGEFPPGQPAARFFQKPAHEAEHDTPRAADESARVTEEFRALARRDASLAKTLALLALVLGIAAEWRARKNLRTWPWRSLLSFALLGCAWRLDAAWHAWSAWFVALAIALAALDLHLRRPGALHLLAWSALLLALVCSRPALPFSGQSPLVIPRALRGAP